MTLTTQLIQSIMLSYSFHSLIENLYVKLFFSFSKCEMLKITCTRLLFVLHFLLFETMSEVGAKVDPLDF